LLIKVAKFCHYFPSESSTVVRPQLPSLFLVHPLSPMLLLRPFSPWFLAVNRARRRPPKSPSHPVTARRHLWKRTLSLIKDSRPPSSTKPRQLLHRRRSSPEHHNRRAPVPPRWKSFSPVSISSLIVLITQIKIQRPRLDRIPELVPPYHIASHRSQASAPSQPVKIWIQIQIQIASIPIL
jgi:hypothetical protein